MRFRLNRLAVTFGVVATVAAAALSGAANASASAASDAAGVVDGLIPGARVSLVQPAAGASSDSAESSVVGANSGSAAGPFSKGGASSAADPTLQIQLPANAIPANSTPAETQFDYYELAWKAELAAGAVDVTQPISGWQVTPSTGTVPSAVSDVMHGSFASGGSSSSDSNLDTMSSATALAQLQSNLAALKQAMPSGTVEQASAQVLPVGTGTDEYALEADVTLAQASDITGHYGDALVGLETGLLGDPSTSPIEGIAVNVVAADGAPIASEWNSTRSGIGTTDFADPSAVPSALAVTTTFPDTTGIPAIKAEVTGAARSVSTKTHSVAASRVIRLTPAHRTASGATSPWIFAAITGGALLLLAAGFVVVRLLRSRRSGPAAAI